METKTYNIYHLVICYSSPWYRWPIEIDDFPIKTYHLCLRPILYLNHLCRFKRFKRPIVASGIAMDLPVFYQHVRSFMMVKPC